MPFPGEMSEAARFDPFTDQQAANAAVRGLPGPPTGPAIAAPQVTMPPGWGGTAPVEQPTANQGLPSHLTGGHPRISDVDPAATGAPSAAEAAALVGLIDSGEVPQVPAPTTPPATQHFSTETPESPPDNSHMAKIYQICLSQDGLREGTENDGLVWKIACKSGTLALSPGPGQIAVDHPLHLTTELFNDMVLSLNEKAFPYCTVPETHNNGSLENTGYVRKGEVITKLQASTDPRVSDKAREIIKDDPDDTTYLLAGIDFTEPEAKKKALNGSIPDVSIGVKFNWRNTRTGKLFNAAWEHLALTPAPWIDGLPAFGLSTERGPQVFDAELHDDKYDGVYVDLPTEQEQMDLAALKAKERNKLPDSAFAIPDERKFPINDESHARNALSRASGTEYEDRVKAAVKKRYPDIDLNLAMTIRQREGSNYDSAKAKTAIAALQPGDEWSFDYGVRVQAMVVDGAADGGHAYMLNCGYDSPLGETPILFTSVDALMPKVDAAVQAQINRREMQKLRDQMTGMAVAAYSILPGEPGADALALSAGDTLPEQDGDDTVSLDLSTETPAENHNMPTAEEILAQQQADIEKMAQELAETRAQLALSQGVTQAQGEQLRSDAVRKRIAKAQLAGVAPSLCLAAREVLLADKSPVVTPEGQGLNLSITTGDGEAATTHTMQRPSDIVEYLLSAAASTEGDSAALMASILQGDGIAELQLAATPAERTEKTDAEKQAEVDAWEKQHHPERFDSDGNRK